MDIYTALRDDPGRKSALIGPFSSEQKARGACQEDADEDAAVSGIAPVTLRWADDSAALPDGSTYVVVLGNLDQRTGYSD